MRTGPLAVAISLGLLIGGGLAPTADAFGGRGGRGGGGFGGRPSGFHQQGFKGPSGFKGFHGGFNGAFPGFDRISPGFKAFPGFDGFRGFKGKAGFGPFFPWGGATVWAAPFYYGYAGPVYYPSTYYAPEYAAPYAPVYAAPPVYAPPMAGSLAVAPAPPLPSVVSFPGGRYELRGDGVTTQYQWVWIPNPPAGPPAPPTAPPPAPPDPSGGEPPAADRPAAPRSQLYRWTDDQGAVHWTNRPDAVPAKYRSQAKYPPSS